MDTIKDVFISLQIILIVIYGFVLGTVIGYICKLLGLDVILSGAIVGAITGLSTIIIFSKTGK
jgi:hypothetical protein